MPLPASNPLLHTMTNPAPTLTVVMPVYNGVRFLARAIESLRAQTFSDWELLAVDDASTDDSATLLDQFAKSDRRIRVFRHQTNRGPSAARNTALGAVRGKLIAYLDCDDEFYADHLAHALDLLESADVFLFKYDLVEEREGTPGYGTTTTYDPSTRSQFMLTETIAVPLGVMHRHELIGRVGGFNEKLWRDEDGDLWRRFAQAGARFTIVPHKSGRYHVRTDSLARTGKATMPRGLPSPIGTVEIKIRGQRHLLQISTGEAWLAQEIFERHEYGGIPPGVLREAPIVVDIGANIGAFALYVKLLYHQAALIHCFEPYPPNVELLRQNVAPFPGVTVHPVGLGADDRQAELLLHANNSGANSTRPDLVPNPIGRVRILIRNAGVMWDELGLAEVDVLKIDAEGAEVEILES
ncbi:MAG TPA: FkbM family methyltransferase, partial [Gemmata sp.]|nr:FkbM family methyltransferase [Gemmata sp.]